LTVNREFTVIRNRKQKTRTGVGNTKGMGEKNRRCLAAAAVALTLKS
jgi:hypothetical protein